MWWTVVWGFVKGLFGGKSSGGSWRDYLPYIVLVLIAGVIWWKVSGVISDYKEQIATLQTTIEEKDKKITQLEKDVLVAELDVEVQKNNVLTLKHSLETQNQAIDQLKVDEDKLKAEVDKWKHQPPKTVIKYIEKKLDLNDYKTITVENCTKLNENISNLRYADLK